uniref:Serine and arginine rich splicing factor 3 n=1 Tax=Gallus gallus TaxID=9031 RepID=A0A8V0ZY95_CHICK
MHRDSCPLDCKVYVGNLGNNGNKTELERAFGYYGPHIPGQSAQLFIYQMSSQQLQQQPSANKKAGKIHNTPFANQLNTTQHLAKPFQQILLGSQSGSLTSPFLAC